MELAVGEAGAGLRIPVLPAQSQLAIRVSLKRGDFAGETPIWTLGWARVYRCSLMARPGSAVTDLSGFGSAEIVSPTVNKTSQVETPDSVALSTELDTASPT